MKRFFFLITIFLFSLAGCKTISPVVQTNPEIKTPEQAVSANDQGTVNFSEQTTWLLGYFSFSQLTRQPHSIWYLKEFDEYQLNNEPLEKLLRIPKDELTIKIVMGSWCPDSRREVPRFMRIIDKWQFPIAKVTFIGVDNAKLSPVGEYERLNIERVPTFIIYKNNIEAGRIIENPKTSLEQDMVNILTGMNNNK
jgi:thiol-disulfide isomerase/thioredoxin